MRFIYAKGGNMKLQGLIIMLVYTSVWTYCSTQEDGLSLAQTQKQTVAVSFSHEINCNLFEELSIPQVSTPYHEPVVATWESDRLRLRQTVMPTVDIHRAFHPLPDTFSQEKKSKELKDAVQEEDTSLEIICAFKEPQSLHDFLVENAALHIYALCALYHVYSLCFP